jgi:hypothetical protein
VLRKKVSRGEHEEAVGSHEEEIFKASSEGAAQEERDEQPRAENADDEQVDADMALTPAPGSGADLQGDNDVHEDEMHGYHAREDENGDAVMNLDVPEDSKNTCHKHKMGQREAAGPPSAARPGREESEAADRKPQATARASCSPVLLACIQSILYCNGLSAVLLYFYRIKELQVDMQQPMIGATLRVKSVLICCEVVESRRLDVPTL